MAGEACISPANGNRANGTRFRPRKAKPADLEGMKRLVSALSPWVRVVNGELRCLCRICRVSWTAEGSELPRRCGNPKLRHVWWYKARPNRKQKPLPNPALDLLRNDFPLHCRRLRTRMKKNQHEFAKLLGVTNVTVSRMESGAHSPQKRHLEKFMELQREFDNRKRKK